MRLGILPLVVLSAGAQTAQSPLPNSELKDPVGQRILFRLHTLANSVQIYTCRQTDHGFAWTGPDPDAILMSSDGKLTVHHYKGPVWEATDGSMVRSDGKLARHFLARQEDAVHWLELPALEPAKKFGRMTFIHRIDTAGGLPPSNRVCDAQHTGEQERVKYSATYLFYGPK